MRAVQPGDAPVLEVQTESGDTYTVHARFILDASGFGRVLPRLLNLEAPTGMPLRAALFTHVQDALPAGMTDRNKICIAVHPERRDVWYWMIPLANGRSSVGCVAEASFLDIPEAEREAALRALIRAEPNIASLIGDAPFLMPVRHIGDTPPTSRNCMAPATRCSATPVNSWTRVLFRRDDCPSLG